MNIKSHYNKNYNYKYHTVLNEHTLRYISDAHKVLFII